MEGLTSGHVAGIIAFLALIVKIVFPTALSFILAGQLRDGETAATWTVAATPLQSSYWPTWLNADASQSHGVRRSVSWTALALPALATLTGITGIVTPLGLHEKDMEDGKTKTPSFAYAPDSTGFGAGTSPRTGQPFTRTCDYRACPAPCPYTTDVEVVTENDFSANCSSSFALNTTVPDKLYEIFQSGTSTSRNTLSGFFDIGWRQLTNQYNKTANNGDPVASGAFRHLESFSLQGGYRTVEGLVVDSKNGGVGFRNHTLPENHSKGATWSEDLLFLEPDSYCVDNNITIDFNMTTSDVGDTIVKNLVLVDHGGFVDMNTTNPAKDRHGEDNTPDLQTRAYIAAWTTNAVSMLTLNVSNPAGTPDKDTKAFSYIESKLEKEFELPLPSLRVDNERFQSLDILQNLGQYLGYGPGNAEGSKKFKNPWNITSDEFDTGRYFCEAATPGMPTKLNNTFVSCAMVRGIPRRVDKGPSMIFDDGSRWSSPVYTCASAIKATIKTVTFFHNDTTDNIDNLAIKGVKEKEYPDDRSMPLWGVENWSYTLGQYDPVWGLVDGTYEHFDKVTTIRQPYLYLIGTSEQRYATFQPSGTFMNLPGTIAPFVSMTSVSAIGTTDLTTVADFTARTGMSLWMKWRNLTGSADTTPQIIKLLWTDLAASAMVGTKGILGAGNAHLDSAVEIPVTPTVHRVTFDYAYAVPAFVTLFCMVIVLVLLIVSIARGRASIKIMDQRLKQTSIGRSLTTLFSPESSSFVMPSKDWSGTNGHRMLDLRMGLPIPLGPSGGTGPTQSSTFYSKMGSKPAWAEGLSPTETFGDDVELVQQNPSSRG